MKSMYSTHNPMNFVATGRFSFHKKNLYYSFYISEKASRPRALQFVDHTGSILIEHDLQQASELSNIYQNVTGKICGVWRRIPRDYRRLLRDDQMSVVLLWGGKHQAELALAGQIGKYPALATETFSSLLEPAPGTNSHEMSGAGGTAIVSTISGTTPSVHVTIVFNGVFSKEELSDVPLNIRIDFLDKRPPIIEEIRRITKPSNEINIIEFSSAVSPNDLRFLTRGSLSITVESKKNPFGLRIQGNIVSRLSCELFQTVLTAHNPNTEIPTTGLAWLYMNRQGSLVYNIQTDHATTPIGYSIALIDNGSKKKTEMERVDTIFENNLTTGIIDKLGPRIIEPLYSNSISIVLSNEIEPVSSIKGRLISRPVVDARDSDAPTLLHRTESTMIENIAGMGWLAVDIDCYLHYEITLAGIHNQPIELYLKELPLEVPGAPVTRKFLEEFNGNYLEGSNDHLSKTELSKLKTNVIYIEIVSKNKNETLLKSLIKPMNIPNRCLPSYTDNDVPTLARSTEPNDISTMDRKCYHSGRFYDDGAHWKSLEQSCTMCSCVHERVKCDPIKCAPLKCKETRKMKGQCCESCIRKFTIIILSILISF